MGHILAFVSVKGGVGKTTMALETASALANHYDKKVLLVDANFSAPNVGLYLDLNSDSTLHHALSGEGLHNSIYETHGFDVVPASMDYNDEYDMLKLKKVLLKMKERYDFIIIDSSPHYSELIPVMQAAEKVFVVTTPDEVTLKTSLKAAQIAKQENTPVEGIIINRIRRPIYEMSLKDIESGSSIPVVARIKDNRAMSEALFHRKPMMMHDNENEVSKEVRRFAAALCGVSEEVEGFFQRLLPFRSLFGQERVNRELLKEKFYRSN
jgi:MinD-like ATPase involved in chromosome partitioning or flagellar assembly